MQRRLVREMKQLLVEDEELRQANLGLVRAQLALSGETRIAPVWSEYRQVEPGDDGLPFDALRMFEVRIGRNSWSHLLASLPTNVTPWHQRFTLNSTPWFVKPRRCTTATSSSWLKWLFLAIFGRSEGQPAAPGNRKHPTQIPERSPRR